MRKASFVIVLILCAALSLSAQAPAGMTSAQLAGFSFRMPEIQCGQQFKDINYDVDAFPRKSRRPIRL